MSQHCPIKARKYVFSRHSIWVTFRERQALYYCITINRLNDLETINYKTNERKDMYVCKHTCRVSGFRDEQENVLDCGLSSTHQGVKLVSS